MESVRAFRRELGDVVREQSLQQRERARAAGFDLAHVRDVEDPARLTHSHVLLAHTLILDRHLPAGEVHELGPGSHVTVKQGGAPERLRRVGAHWPAG